MTPDSIAVMQALGDKHFKEMATGTDFKTWKRETLEQFARQAADENKALQENNKALHAAWRAEVTKNER